MSNDTVRRAVSHRPTIDRRTHLQREEHPSSPAGAAVELWATFPRFIGQETPSSGSLDPWPDTGGPDGNRRFRLLNGLIDCAARHFHGSVIGTRAEHHGVNASVWKTSPGNAWPVSTEHRGWMWPHRGPPGGGWWEITGIERGSAGAAGWRGGGGVGGARRARDEHDGGGRSDE